MKFADLKPGMNEIFQNFKTIEMNNQDMVGNKCVKDKSGNLYS